MTPNKMCPVACRRCGNPLIVEKRWLAGVKYKEKVDLFQSSIEMDYRIRAICQLRKRWLGVLRFYWHDAREFSEDCTIEYTGFQKRI